MSGIWTVMSWIHIAFLTLPFIFAIVFNRIYIEKESSSRSEEKQSRTFNTIEKDEKLPKSTPVPTGMYFGSDRMQNPKRVGHSRQYHADQSSTNT
jgi:hypothetical protein